MLGLILAEFLEKGMSEVLTLAILVHAHRDSQDSSEGICFVKMKRKVTSQLLAIDFLIC